MMKWHDFKLHRGKLWPRLNVSSKILGNEMSKTKDQASIKIPLQLQLHFKSFQIAYGKLPILLSEVPWKLQVGYPLLAVKASQQGGYPYKALHLVFNSQVSLHDDLFLEDGPASLSSILFSKILKFGACKSCDHPTYGHYIEIIYILRHFWSHHAMLIKSSGKRKLVIII